MGFTSPWKRPSRFVCDGASRKIYGRRRVVSIIEWVGIMDWNRRNQPEHQRSSLPASWLQGWCGLQLLPLGLPPNASLLAAPACLVFCHSIKKRHWDTCSQNCHPPLQIDLRDLAQDLFARDLSLQNLMDWWGLPFTRRCSQRERTSVSPPLPLFCLLTLW